MKREDAVIIDLNQWVKSGEGNQGESYVKKDDNMVILKLYSEMIDPDMVIREVEMSTSVKNAGILCPDAGCLVRCGNRYGIIFSRIVGKKSFCTAVAENPGCISDMARRMAKMAKDMHGRSAEGTPFKSVVNEYVRLMECIPMEADIKAVGERYLRLIRNEDRKTIVHGDFHFGNVITDGVKDFFIDLGMVGYGHPDNDNSMFFIIATGMPEEVEMRDYHITLKQSVEFWNEYKYVYYGPDAPSNDVFFERFKPYLFMRSLLVERDCGKSPLNDSLRRKFAGLE